MRKNLVIDSRMKELWPAVRVGCLQYQVQVERKNPELWAYLKKEIYKKAKDAIFDYGVNEIPNIKESRAAYKAFGKDPSRYRVSSEALIRRIGQGKRLYEVNTVVDVNNLISIESGFSVGSYDAARMGEDLVFRIGEAGETYKGIGKEEIKLLQKQIDKHCSQFERRVLSLYLQGYDYHQIAKAMGKTPKSIDNALQRIKKKVQQIAAEV